jgi:hypothetical protein
VEDNTSRSLSLLSRAECGVPAARTLHWAPLQATQVFLPSAYPKCKNGTLIQCNIPDFLFLSCASPFQAPAADRTQAGHCSLENASILPLSRRSYLSLRVGSVCGGRWWGFQFETHSPTLSMRPSSSEVLTCSSTSVVESEVAV